MAETHDWPDASLFRDWDYFASMAQTLRTYLYDYHTIPTWNFMLCGGKPELANPQSWAFTWPSLIVYLLPPNAALIALWVLMTLVGAGGMVALLRRLGADAVGAVVGAALYVGNGYFAAHFVVGHATFAFFHLVPVMTYLGLKLLDQWQLEPVQRRHPMRLVALNIGIAFLFYSAALPHALFYFYLAYPLTLLIGVGLAIKQGAAPLNVGRGLALAALAQVLGILLAGYKLWPIIAWQLQMPRQGVLAESTSLVDLVGNLNRFIPNYDDLFATVIEGQSWFSWEYGAFVGFTPFLLVLGAGVLTRQQWQRQSRREPLPLAFAVGLAAMVLGFNLAAGNDNMFSLAQLFKHLPLVSGIRVFGRFQILEIYGLTCLVALAVTIVLRHLPAPQRRRGGVLLFVLVVAPGVWQTVTLVRTIKGSTQDELAAQYALEPVVPGACPLIAKQKEDLKRGRWDQYFLLRSGYWVANCYEPMVSHKPKLRGYALALTSPPPSKLLDVGRDWIALSYDSLPSEPVEVHLSDAEQMSFDQPTTTDRFGAASVSLQASAGGVRFVATRPQASTAEGVETSVLGLALTGLVLAVVRRRGPAWRAGETHPPV